MVRGRQDEQRTRGRQPGGDARRAPVGHDIHGLGRGEVNNEGAVASAASESEIIDPNGWWRCRGGHRRAAHQTQEGVGTRGQPYSGLRCG